MQSSLTRSRKLLWFIGLVSSVGFAVSLSVWPRNASSQDTGPRTLTESSAAQIAAAMEAGDCHRCHVVPERAPVERIDSCADCHIWIRSVASHPEKRAKALEIFPYWERYERNVASYMTVPPLDAAMHRLEPSWVRAYLQDPHDLRPGLPESMPRFALKDEHLNAIESAFRQATRPVPAQPAPSASRVAEGERLYGTLGCGTCHTFGGNGTSAGLPSAPDLAHTRSRMSPDRVVAWIQDPKAVSPGATMTSLGVSREEAIAIRDYLFLAELKWTPEPSLGPHPTATTRPVAFAEVQERVFGKICVHCHMNPATNEGRAGPGNAGGFGWPATGIELETYEGIAAAADRIPAALLRRRVEAHRDVVSAGHAPVALTRPEKPGMPLGLPPLSDEDTALVLGWLEQGMPR